MRSSLPSRRFTAGLLTVALASASLPVLTPRVATAQSDEDKAAARQLATDGAKAMDEKRWKDAIDMFTRAESLVHSPQHLLYLARAHVQIGKLVKAREFYLKIVKEDIPAGKPKSWTDAKTAAQAEIGPLEPKIPQLKIVVEGGDKSVEVKQDGEVVKSALIGVSRPVDPGEHVLEAKDGAGLVAKQTITLSEGGNETVTLKLEAPKSGGGDKKDPPPADPKDTPPPEKKDPPPDAGTGEPSKVLPFTLIGVGVVGLAVGTVFLLKWNSTKADADALCPDNKCGSKLAEAEELDSQWKSQRTLSFVGYGVGIVAAGVGITLLLTSKSSPPPAPAAGAWVRPFVGVGSLGLYGAF